MKKKSIPKAGNKLEPLGWLPAVMPLLLVLAAALSAAYFVISYQGSASLDFSRRITEPTIVDVIQLENKYENRLRAAVNAYLEFIDLRDSEFLAKTQRLKEQLLTLVVPAKYRDKHLAVVLALDKIEADSQRGDWQAVEQEMEKIKKNCQSF